MLFFSFGALVGLVMAFLGLGLVAQAIGFVAAYLDLAGLGYLTEIGALKMSRSNISSTRLDATRRRVIP